MLFAYNLFNTNKTGHMTKEECLQMLHIVFRNGKALDKHTHKVVSVEEIAAHQAYTHIHTHIHNTTQDGEVVSFEQFEKLIKDYPEIVFPAFRLRCVIVFEGSPFICLFIIIFLPSQAFIVQESVWSEVLGSSEQVRDDPQRWPQDDRRGVQVSCELRDILEDY